MLSKGPTEKAKGRVSPVFVNAAVFFGLSPSVNTAVCVVSRDAPVICSVVLYLYNYSNFYDCSKMYD